MARKLLFLLISMPFFFGLASPIFALEKVKLGTSVKMYPAHYLPSLTAEERGFWKENGLEVEWVIFAGGGPQMRAVAAAAINIGFATNAAFLTAASAGLPGVMVAELLSKVSWNIWVKTDSPYRHPADLKGARIGVTALGGITHAFGRIVAKAHGIEKDVRFVGAGGAPVAFAGLQAGAFGASVNAFSTGVTLKLEGVVRDIASTVDYLPQPWFEDGVFARKDFARSNPDTVRRMIKATLQATDFLRKNPRWAMDKMKSFQGLSEEAAKLVFDDTQFTSTGKLDQKALENVRKVFIEYGILTQKAPPVDELFTNEYVP